ncbi:hypothetical protein [Amycolatopsis sp. NPDC051903]|uniref:hypothetical protein n=1 Tax=Amycolatopsis sp. NPDC051903 TaxID=3363936 RepID=UPI003790972B
MSTHTTAGRPAAVSVTVPLGAICVEVRADVETASLSLAPHLGTDTAAAGALAAAVITEADSEDGPTLTVRLPRRPAAFRRTGFVTALVTDHDGRPAGQVVASSGETTTVNGHIVGENAAVRVPTGALDAVLIVPAGTRLLLEAGDGTITTRGPAGQVTAALRSGTVQVEHAETVVAAVGSGSIQVGVVENVEATVATFGGIQIGRITGSAVLRTGYGAIRARTSTADVSACSGSGEVEITTIPAAPAPGTHPAHGLAHVR